MFAYNQWMDLSGTQVLIFSVLLIARLLRVYPCSTSLRQHQMWSLRPSIQGQNWVWPCTKLSSLQPPEVKVMLCHGIWCDKVSCVSASVRKFPIQVFKCDTFRSPYNHFLNKMRMFAAAATEKPLLCKPTSGQLLTWTVINIYRGDVRHRYNCRASLGFLFAVSGRKIFCSKSRSCNLTAGQGLTCIIACCLPVCLLVKHLGLHLIFYIFAQYCPVWKSFLVFQPERHISLANYSIWFPWPSAFWLKCRVLEILLLWMFDLIING